MCLIRHNDFDFQGDMKTTYKGRVMTHWACLICYRTFPLIFRGILEKMNLQLISLVVFPVSVKIFAFFFFYRVLTELVSKMRDMQMDKTELGCLRAIVLFNPGTVMYT